MSDRIQTEVRNGLVESADREAMIILVKEDDAEMWRFHWTSFWSDYPGQTIVPGDRVELVCQKGKRSPLALRLKTPEKSGVRCESCGALSAGGTHVR